MNVFDNITNDELRKLLKCLDARKLSYSKDNIIISNMSNANVLGIILSGSANLIRVDYNGNKSIIEILSKGDVFSSNLFNIENNELSIMALEDTEIYLITYDRVMHCCSKNCIYHRQLIDNLLEIIINKLNSIYERIQILTKKSIREKLLAYFKFVSYKKNSKKFKIPMNYTTLANYLAIDRSALMREIKNLRDDKIIEVNGKIITILTN